MQPLPSTAALPNVTGLAGELRIEREDGTTLTTVGDVIEGHLVPARGPAQWREYLFPETAYIATRFPVLPRVRLHGLRVHIELVVAFTQNIEVRLETLVGLILKVVIRRWRVRRTRKSWCAAWREMAAVDDGRHA